MTKNDNENNKKSLNISEIQDDDAIDSKNIKKNLNIDSKAGPISNVSEIQDDAVLDSKNINKGSDYYGLKSVALNKTVLPVSQMEMSKEELNNIEPYKKLSQRDLEQKFNDGELLARSSAGNQILLDDSGKLVYDGLRSTDRELSHLTSTTSVGIHKNVEIHGNRSRSGVLITPLEKIIKTENSNKGSKMGFGIAGGVSLIHDANDVLIRKRYLRDAGTGLANPYGRVYGAEHLEHPTISNKEFLDKYQDSVLPKQGGPNPMVNSAMPLPMMGMGPIKEQAVQYNEVIGTVSDKSLIAVASEDSSDSKTLRMLTYRNDNSRKIDKDLTMIQFNDQGKPEIF